MKNSILALQKNVQSYRMVYNFLHFIFMMYIIESLTPQTNQINKTRDVNSESL